MDDDEATRETPTLPQCAPSSEEANGNENETPVGTATCNLITTNDLSAMTPTETLHQHCNESSCDIAFQTTENNRGSVCQFTGHHYHYIEYPGVYCPKNFAQNANVAMPQSTNSNTYHYCLCSCSSNASNGRLQMSSEPRLQQSQQPQPQQQQQLQQQHESRLAVAAIVHQQSIDADCGLRAKSQQSLLSHSYQMLNIPPEKIEKSEHSCQSKLNINCDSAACTCTTSTEQQEMKRPNLSCKKLTDALADSVLATADEITVSESDNNGSLTKRKNMRESRVQKKINSWYAKNYNCNHIEIYSDGDEGDNNQNNDALTSVHGSLTNILDQRPPLPPRPQTITVAQNTSNTLNAHRPGSQSIKKYVIWCLVCGGFSCLLGALFLGVYFLLHSYTITVGNFETVPTFVPATLLILTGLCIMSLARRRNRYSYLIKLSGACGLISALTCALVTVTTTVLHMSRLQALRECEYAQKTRTCTCYSDMIESQVDRVDKEGVRLVFDSLSDCGVVHGSLYSCLRAIFGLSVAGVLVAVFSCMLVYQLLSHERKKMYWEQLELRCRSLYSSHQQQHQHQQQGPSAHSMAALAGIGTRSAPICRCCEQCHAHRQLQLQTASYPWVDDSGEPRFWAGQPPGNFYSPNPGGDENNLHVPSGTNSRTRISSGWSWPRMPWQRSSTESGNRFRQIPSSPDSQYGFSSTNPSLGMAVNNIAISATAEEDATAAAVAAVAAATATQRSAQAYNIVTGGAALPYGIWGPPPPYSDPNSPARRGFYQYMQPSNSICTANRIGDSNLVGSSDDVLQQRPLSAGALNALAAGSTPNVGVCVAQRTFDHITQRLCNTEQLQNIYKSKENCVGATLNNNYGNTGSDSDVDSVPTRFGDRFSNTLPTRKIKKRVVDGSNSIAKCVGSGSRHQFASQRINVQRVFPHSSNSTSENDGDPNCNTRPLNTIRYGKSYTGNSKDNRPSAYSTESGNNNRILQKILITDHSVQRCNDGVENTACINNCDGIDTNNDAMVAVVPTICSAPYEDPTESEIYFADVSSCCNMSMKNDNCYEDSCRNTQQQQQPHQQSSSHGLQQSTQRITPKQSQQHFHHHHHQHQRSGCSQSSNQSSGSCCTPKEDYLLQHFNQRENSIRIRPNHIQSRQSDSYNTKLNMMQLKTANGINNDTSSEFTCAAKADSKTESNIPKDISLHSMCSIESETKTECTDLSPMTPCGNKNPTETIFQCGNNHTAEPQTANTSGFSNFIASFPYSSESKFHEAHRRFTKHMHDNLITKASAAAEVQETHYEVIKDDNQLNRNSNNKASVRVPSTMNSQQQKPKNLNSNSSYDKSSINRSINRSTKTKDNLDAVWSSTDASGSGHNRQRL